MRKLIFVLSAMTAIANAETANTNALPEPRILKWPDGKRGAFMLLFDDSCETHITRAIPELIARDLVGTFYINPGNGPYLNRRKDWEETYSNDWRVVIANHTFKHKGAPDLATVEEDIALCKEVTDRVFNKNGRRLSFGQPGGVPWNITKDECDTLLAKYDLILRPPFFGYPIHIQTEDETLALVDQAIEKGELRHNVFHGVGGDWLSMPMDIYTNLLDKLVANRDKLWITDPVSYHKYTTERDAAKLTLLPDSTPEKLCLRLDLATDPELYDELLTAEIQVPEDFENISVEQFFDDDSTILNRHYFGCVHNGVFRFRIAPRKSVVTIAKHIRD
ncbi:MAG: hypothetical protein FWG05_04040 [Kiritimatiellaeota bacterium]|nr:hypothetical protein [Kiritimatiellota bacterium]